MKRSFTALEMFVVIAVLAVLAALLLPALNKTQGKAVESACINNQRQLGLAMFQYSDDFTEFLPPGLAWQHPIQDAAMKKFAGANDYSLWLDLCYPYYGDLKTALCPADNYAPQNIPKSYLNPWSYVRSMSTGYANRHSSGFYKLSTVRGADGRIILAVCGMPNGKFAGDGFRDAETARNPYLVNPFANKIEKVPEEFSEFRHGGGQANIAVMSDGGVSIFSTSEYGKEIHWTGKRGIGQGAWISK